MGFSTPMDDPPIVNSWRPEGALLRRNFLRGHDEHLRVQLRLLLRDEPGQPRRGKPEPPKKLMCFGLETEVMAGTTGGVMCPSIALVNLYIDWKSQ